MEVLGIGIDAPVIISLIPDSGNITDIHELTPAMFRQLQQTMTEIRGDHGVIHQTDNLARDRYGSSDYHNNHE